MTKLAIIEAPSNLGLRPPAPDAVPGVGKLPAALRDAGLMRRLPAVERGVVVAPRYRGAWDGRSVRNEAALHRYSQTLAARVHEALDAGETPLVVGGDCSVLLGIALALRRRGRHGLLFADGHSDFRHAGNSEAVQAAAGEDLALVTGRGTAALADVDGLGPYVEERDVFLLGIRGDDDFLPELRELGVAGLEAADVRRLGAARAAERALAHVHAVGLESFWVHVDADVVDPSFLPAVDAPAPGGLSPDELAELLQALVAADGFAGMDVTILDPDLDDSGEQAAILTDVLVAALGRRFGRADARQEVAPAQAPDRQELLTALTTEHFTLQGARSQTASESASRASLYILSVSSTLVALGFIGQASAVGTAFHVFALTVLPTLYVLGVFSFVRVVECGAEDFRYGVAINRIRGYYKQLAGDQARLFLLSGHDDGRGVFENAAIPPGRRRQYFTFATVVAVINSVAGGSAIAIALGAIADAPLGVAAGAGGITALVSLVVLLRYADRLLQERTAGTESIFPTPPPEVVDLGS